MSLEYYLLCRDNFDNIISDLKAIIENYEKIFSYTDELDMVDNEYLFDLFQPLDLKVNYESKLNHTKYCRNYCNHKIQQLCTHEFITDYIDITPDNSQKITYCRICNYPK